MLSLKNKIRSLKKIKNILRALIVRNDKEKLYLFTTFRKILLKSILHNNNIEYKKIMALTIFIQITYLR